METRNRVVFRYLKVYIFGNLEGVHFGGRKAGRSGGGSVDFDLVLL